MKTFFLTSLILFSLNYFANAQLVEAEGDVKLDNTLELFDRSSGTPTRVGMLQALFPQGASSLNSPTLTLKTATSPISSNGFADIILESSDAIYMNTNTSTRMYVGPSGRVGVGTTLPGKLFHVAGDAIVGGNTNFDGASEHIRFEAQSDNWHIGALNENSQAGTDFIIGLSSGPSSFFHLENSGDLGLGTSNPIAKLDVHDSGSNPFRLTTTSDNNFATYLTANGHIGYQGIYNNDYDMDFGTSILNALGSVHLVTQTNPRLTVDPSGQVGIGTTSPARLLDVNGLSWMRDDLTIDDGDLVLRSSNNHSFRLRTETSGDLSFVGDGGTVHMEITDQLGRVGIGTTAPSVKFHVTGGGDAEPSGGGYAQFGTTSGRNLAIDNNEIMVRNNGVADDLFIQHDGGDLLLCSDEQGSVGVGILAGSSIPSGYLLAVDGKIIGEEVRVELSGAWPDYVFDEDYDLLSIQEFEKSIKENKHLPGIPSAKEVEDQGILLGDMQKRMVEKIEELSLYIIQQQHEIESMKKDLETVKNK